MNRIKEQYDPENDAGIVTWVDMDLCREVQDIQKKLLVLAGIVHDLSVLVENLVRKDVEKDIQ